MFDSQEQNVRLRDERKACHFWIDNEVVDCYEPIVGADAVWVYCRIARYAHGAWIVSPLVRGNDTRVSLREMSGWCGKSPDTVWRCLQVLEYVGLLHAERNTRSAGRYALADVKDLVTREGGRYERELGALMLPPKRVAQLKEGVRALRIQLARKKTVADRPSSVAQSDSLSGQLFSVPSEKCDRSVAPDVQICRSERQTPYLYKARKQEVIQHPLTPSPARGDAEAESNGEELPGKGTQAAGVGAPESAGAEENELTPEQREHLAQCAPEMRKNFAVFYREENAKKRQAVPVASDKAAPTVEFGSVAEARAWVMRECGYVESRRRRGVGAVIDSVLQQCMDRGESFSAVACKMARAAKRYADNGSRMRYLYGPVKFFELGLWNDENKWPWDYAALKRASSMAF